MVWCMHEARKWCGACMWQFMVWCGYDMVMGWLVVFVDGVEFFFVFVFLKMLSSDC